MKKLNSLLLSAILIAVSSLPAMAAEDSGISVVQATPAESTGGIAPSAALPPPFDRVSNGALLIGGLTLLALGLALGGGGGGGSNTIATGATR